MWIHIFTIDMNRKVVSIDCDEIKKILFEIGILEQITGKNEKKCQISTLRLQKLLEIEK